MPAKKKSPGRPRKSSDVAKSESILVRLAPAEKKAFSDAADLSSLPMSSWVRERLRRVALGELKKAGRSVAFLPQAVAVPGSAGVAR